MTLHFNFILFCLLVSQAAGCEKAGPALPGCIEEKINAFKQESKHNPPAEVWIYSYHGKDVYFISEYCCDVPSQVLDDECQSLCSPGGGLTGKGDGKCPQFFKEATNGRRLWKDDR